jgi:hypothetical protein
MNFLARSTTLAALGVITACSAVEQQAQEERYAVPRTAYGQPDLQGVWQAMNTAVWDVQDHAASLGVPAGEDVVVGGEIPYRPGAAEQREANFHSRLTDDPEANCKMVGVPRITYLPYPFQIIQTPTQVTILYEYVHTFRNIYLGSDHPTEMEGPLWMGDSRGRWEGDTLVVDVAQFTDQTWLDRSGNFHSDALHVIERYTRSGPDHISYEVTVEDPEVFTESWQMHMPLYRRQEENIQLLEYECFAYLEAERERRSKN